MFFEAPVQEFAVPSLVLDEVREHLPRLAMKLGMAPAPLEYALDLLPLRQQVPVIAGCYALMPTRDEALAELSHVFDMFAEEFLERGIQLPEGTTEIVNA